MTGVRRRCYSGGAEGDPVWWSGAKARLKYYRKFVYNKGSLDSSGKESEKGFEIGALDRFRYRTRYFTDSGIIGTKSFVNRLYLRFKGHFSSKE